MRKALSYIQFGVMPDIYSVPCKNMFHNYIDETFRYIPELINDKTGLQSNSKERSRKTKKAKKAIATINRIAQEDKTS